jgi:ribonucleoside-diphosphate reductase alpha chain
MKHFIKTPLALKNFMSNMKITPGLRKKTMAAEEVFKSGILKERTDTGRIYLVFIDNVMDQGPFDPEYHTIYQSNLCCEILLPTKPFKRLDDEEGRIALCTLGLNQLGCVPPS